MFTVIGRALSPPASPRRSRYRSGLANAEAAISSGALSLDSVSIRDIAERAAVAPGLIHHYFPSLDALLTESFGTWADVILTRLRTQSEGVSPKMALALTVANLYPEQRIWNDALSTASRFSQLRDRAPELSVKYGR